MIASMTMTLMHITMHVTQPKYNDALVSNTHTFMIDHQDHVISRRSFTGTGCEDFLSPIIKLSRCMSFEHWSHAYTNTYIISSQAGFWFMTVLKTGILWWMSSRCFTLFNVLPLLMEEKLLQKGIFHLVHVMLWNRICRRKSTIRL